MAPKGVIRRPVPAKGKAKAKGKGEGKGKNKGKDMVITLDGGGRSVPFDLVVKGSDTIKNVKARITAHTRVVPQGRDWMLSRGTQLLADGRTLSNYNIQGGTVLTYEEEDEEGTTCPRLQASSSSSSSSSTSSSSRSSSPENHATPTRTPTDAAKHPRM